MFDVVLVVVVFVLLCVFRLFHVAAIVLFYTENVQNKIESRESSTVQYRTLIYRSPEADATVTTG